jgi:adenosine deaminase
MIDLQALPKTELHLHLEGAIPSHVLLELIHKYEGRTNTPSLDELSQRLIYRDFPHFLHTWRWMTGFLREYEDFSWIAQGVACDLADQGVRYAEIYFSPPDFLHHGLELGRIAMAVRSGISACNRPIKIRLIVDLCRQYGPELGNQWLDETLEVAAEADIVGVGLGGPEHLAPPEPYADVYSRAADSGLRRVAHAGEAASSESVWGALRALGVERIGHGIRAIEDPDLIGRLRDTGTPLEVCPTSNVCTGVVPSLEAHPIRELFDAEVRVTISSDDPTFFGSNIIGEYSKLRHCFGFSDEEIIRTARVGFESAFAPDEERAAYLAELNDFVRNNS